MATQTQGNLDEPCPADLPASFRAQPEVLLREERVHALVDALQLQGHLASTVSFLNFSGKSLSVATSASTAVSVLSSCSASSSAGSAEASGSFSAFFFWRFFGTTEGAAIAKPVCRVGALHKEGFIRMVFVAWDLQSSPSKSSSEMTASSSRPSDSSPSCASSASCLSAGSLASSCMLNWYCCCCCYYSTYLTTITTYYY